MTAKASKTKQHTGTGLVGLYFHEPTEHGWHQGQIIARANEEDHYLVQLCSWVDGNPTTLRVASVASMADWSLYRSAEQWRDEGDRISRDESTKQEKAVGSKNDSTTHSWSNSKNDSEMESAVVSEPTPRTIPA